MKGVGRALLTGLLILAASMAWVGEAQAHALLVRSVPEADDELAQPPASIEMWFSEPLEAGFSRARLLTYTGQEVPTGAVSVDPSDLTHMSVLLGQLQPGIYTVAYQTLSRVDGHEWYGSFPFTVLNPDGSRPTGARAPAIATSRADLPTIGEAGSRWLWLLGGMLFLGAPLFQMVTVPAGLRPGQRGNGFLETGARQAALRAIWVATLAITVGHGLQILLQALRLGGSGQLAGLLLGTRTGALVLARQVLAFTGLWVALALPQPWPLRGRERPFFILAMACTAIAWLLLVVNAWGGEGALLIASIVAASLGMGLAAWVPPNDPSAAERRTWQALLVLAGAFLLGISVGSHAGAVPGSLWSVLGDYVHLLAAATWVGGLLLLPMLLWRVHRSPDAWDPDHSQPLLLLVRRFSYVASFAVFLLALTGVFNSLVELPNLPSLWETAYGRVLLVKLGLVALALSVAFLNNRLVHREGFGQSGAARMRRLRRQVAVEAGVTLGLMLSVAVLVQTPAPRSFALETSAPLPSDPFNAILSTDGLYAHVQVSPNQLGNNHFWVHLFHGDGSPIGEVQLVQMRFLYRGAPLGQFSVDLASLGEGAFAVEGAYLSQAGAWDVSVYVRRRGLDDALLEFGLDVPLPGAEVTRSTAWQNPIPAFPPMLIAAGGLMVLGVIPLLWRQPLEQAWPRRYPVFKQAGVLLLLIGFGIGFSLLHWFLHGVGPGGPLVASPGDNPLSPSVASLEEGRALYEQNCLPCHGAAGLGDGPVGLTLNPRPADLRVHMVPGVHTDQQLLEWITNGFPNSVMPAFREVLTEEERWHVLNYIRTLAPQ